jgi:nucleoid-associated protein YgaU
MRRGFAVFSAVLIVFPSSAAWSKRKEYPRYEPPSFEELPGTGLPDTGPSPQPTERTMPEPPRTIEPTPEPAADAATDRPPVLEEPPQQDVDVTPAPTPTPSTVDVTPVPAPDVREEPAPAAEAPPDLEEPPSPAVEAPVEEPAAPAEAAAPEPVAKPVVSAHKPYKVYIWQENGDSLSQIAKKMYGDPQKWRLIYLANKDVIKDPNKIFPKQKLKIPPADWQP